mgnify:CR=1 FL=1
MSKYTDQELLAMFREEKSRNMAFKKSYFSEMKKVIGSRKFAQLRNAEMKFKKELLNKIKGHRGGPPTPPRPR